MTLRKLKDLKKVPNWLSLNTAYALLSILIVAYLAYGLFYVPALYSDDWTQGIERIVTGRATWLDLTNRRPLLFAPFLLQYGLFGLDISIYYIVIWSLNVIMTILLYKIIVRFSLIQPYSFGLIIALLFLVYPTNYTHMWLTMLHGYGGFAMSLLYGYLLIRFAEEGNWLTWGLALGILLISLGLYEGQVGLAGIWPLLLVTLFRHRPPRIRLGLCLPMVLIGIFALWRTLGYQAVGIADSYFSQLVVTPEQLLSRLFLGYKISLGWGWTNTINYFFPWISKALYAFLVLVGTVFTFWWLLSRVILLKIAKEPQVGLAAWSSIQRWQAIRSYLFLAAIGIVLIGVGYVPVIFFYLPTLNGIETRFNLFATVGSAIFFASVLMIGSLLFARNRGQIKHLFLSATIPFLILGVVTQASVQYQTRIAWREQQDIWQKLFLTVPNFVDETVVLFILPGYLDRVGYQNWQRTPLYSSWEVTSGLRLLYDNSTLSADVIFPSIETAVESILTTEGIITKDTGAFTPYARLVAFVYDSQVGTLMQLDHLPPELIGGTVDAIKLCTNCVRSENLINVPLRRLVQN